MQRNLPGFRGEELERGIPCKPTLLEKEDGGRRPSAGKRGPSQRSCKTGGRPGREGLRSPGAHQSRPPGRGAPRPQCPDRSKAQGQTKVSHSSKEKNTALMETLCESWNPKQRVLAHRVERERSTNTAVASSVLEFHRRAFITGMREPHSPASVWPGGGWWEELSLGGGPWVCQGGRASSRGDLYS